jgi:putative sigma-54 modulation protein
MSQTNDFSVSISARHEELSDTVKESITSQIMKLSRYNNHIVDANILVDRHNSTYKVDVSIQLPGSVITACHEDYDQFVALDVALEKTKTQIKKLKEKSVDHRVNQVLQPVETGDIEESISQE